MDMFKGVMGEVHKHAKGLADKAADHAKGLADIVTNIKDNYLGTVKAQNGRLEEKEILSIFNQVCKAIEFMHLQQPPIAHRDLKVENVLYHESGFFKLCDFGSATTATYHPITEKDRNAAEEDINRNTTMTYRAPEMVDLYLKLPITEKVDIWALGCLLYKMAFFADPFEAGPLAILNAKYYIPEVHSYSEDFMDLIAYLLNLQPDKRPNVTQVLERVAKLRNVPYKKQVVPNALPGAPVAAGSPQKAPAAQVSAGPPPPAQVASVTQAAKKNIFDSLEWESSNDVAVAQHIASTNQHPTHTPTEPNTQHSKSASVPKSSVAASSDLLNLGEYHIKIDNRSDLPSKSSASVPNRTTSQTGASLVIPGAHGLFDILEWKDAPNENTNSAPPPVSSGSKPAPAQPQKTRVELDFDPFSASALAAQQQKQSAAPAPAPAAEAPTPDAGPDLLAFDEPAKPTKPNLTTTLPNQRYPPQPGFPPGFAYPQHPPMYRGSPQFQHQFLQPKQAANPYPILNNLNISPHLPRPQPVPVKTGHIEDFDPLAPSSKPGGKTENSSNNTNNTATTVSAKTESKADQLIDFF